jgi:DNA invertase Pin-like site-specific DNA recombinase
MQEPIDTNTAAGKCFVDMLGVFAEFETNLCRERQRDGIAKAKEPLQRSRTVIGADQVHKLKAKALGPTEITKRSGLLVRRSIGRWPPPLWRPNKSACG